MTDDKPTAPSSGAVGPFGRAALRYALRGWPGLLPTSPDSAKAQPLVSGRHGNPEHKPFPTVPELRRWAAQFPDANIALRPPPGALGLDVDAYEGKQGGATLAELEAECGPLPPGWRSSARADDRVSGVRWFRVPEGYRAVRVPGPGIEVIRPGWDYAVVPPSVHPDRGTPYRWYPDDPRHLPGRGPHLHELPALPPAWLDRLAAPDPPPASARAVNTARKFTEGQRGTAYGLAGLARELAELQQVWDGNVEAWNPVLNRVAFAAGQLAAGGELNADHAYAAIEDAMAELGAPADQFKTLRSGWTAGLAKPRTAPRSREVSNLSRPVAGPGLPETGAAPPADRNDIARNGGVFPNSEAPVSAVSPHGRNFGDKYWVARDPKKPDQRSFLMVELAEDVVRLGPLALGIDDRMWAYEAGVWQPTKDIVRHRVAELMGDGFRISYASNAEVIVRAQCQTIHCDPVSEIINFRNGHLDWRTGLLLPHDPNALSTVQLNTEWVPDAECPEFDRFLAEVLPPDIIDMVWELIGYLMYSGNPLHKAVMLHGSGRNGKGVFLRVIKELLGKQNITAATLQALATERFTPASLFGKIANIAGDIDSTYMEQTAMFKAVTGQDEITAEFKNRDLFEFTPWAVPLFSANKIPGSADVTTGYMSRWVVIVFPHDFTGREDRKKTERLITPGELRGIAAKAVPALRRLLERGNFEDPPSARAAMDDFRRKVDQARTWLEERAELDEEAPRQPRTWLYENYKRWAKDGGYGQLKANEFYDRLVAIGLEQSKTRGVRYFKGIRLLPPEREEL